MGPTRRYRCDAAGPVLAFGSALARKTASFATRVTFRIQSRSLKNPPPDSVLGPLLEDLVDLTRLRDVDQTLFRQLCLLGEPVSTSRLPMSLAARSASVAICSSTALEAAVTAAELTREETSAGSL